MTPTPRHARLPVRSLVRDGVRLSVHDSGGAARPMLFQHGLCGSAQQTAEAFPADLIDATEARLLTLECRGHGGSALGPVTDLSIATFTDDLAALVDELASRTPDGRVDLGGISMGAAIALRLAVLRPDQVRSLVLVRPAWVTTPAPDNMRPNAEVGDWLAYLSPAAARTAFDASPTAQLLAQIAPDNLASLRGFFDRAPQQATAELLGRISADGPGISAAALSALRLPVSVIGHAADAIHPMAHARELAALIPGASLVEITPKSVSKTAYLHDLHAALRQHLRSLAA
ncbi:MAG: alpha/beta fold hydrolase [Leptothrix sp. (in: b-proteobacteria)]